jgi:hypothetical protein
MPTDRDGPGALGRARDIWARIKWLTEGCDP